MNFYGNVISVFSLELRELEAKLKAAYMNKERMAQMAEKEAVKYDVMVRSFLHRRIHLCPPS